MSEVARSSSSLAKTKKKKVVGTKKKDTSSIILNWKLALNLSYSLDSVKKVNQDRLWSDFINHFRELCPETNWVSIYTAGQDELDPKLLYKTHRWLEYMVASKMWPCPPQVIISTDHKVNNSIRIIIKNNDKPLPFVETPDGIIAIKMTSQQFTGWDIRLEETLSQSKAGHV